MSEHDKELYRVLRDVMIAAKSIARMVDNNTSNEILVDASNAVCDLANRIEDMI